MLCGIASPPFAVSSAFLRGFLPAPIKPPAERDETMEKAKYAEIKKRKKLKYVSASQYIDAVEETSAEDGKSPFKALGHSHVGINRMTGTAEEGMLYAANEMRMDSSPSGNVEPCKRNGYLDIYIASSYDSARVTKLMKWAFEGGFGAGASRGMGNITADGEAAEVHPSKRLIGGSEAADDTARYMALSPFALPAGDGTIKDLRADIFTRSGKVWNAMSQVPWKKSVVMYDEGATFSVAVPECGEAVYRGDNDRGIETAGMIIGDVHQDKRVCQCALAPIIPI